MTKRNITANLEYEVVQRIVEFQESKKIRHFSDAVGKYIEFIEDYAYPLVVKVKSAKRM